jgi:hypothetical protein
MPLGSIFLFLALLILVAFIVARPLTKDGEEGEGMDQKTSHWVAERERVLDALAELDADWQMGKVPADIYKLQRKQLVYKGALALEKLDVWTKKADRKTKRSVTPSDDLEKMISAYKAKQKRRK